MKGFHYQYGDVEVVVFRAMGDNYQYIVRAGKEAVIVDPAEARPLYRHLRREHLVLRYVLNTHSHFDHTAGNAELVSRTRCTVCGPPGIPLGKRVLEDGDEVEVGGLVFQTLATPGHGREHLCYYAPDKQGGGLLWTGDLLFTSGCGRLFGSRPDQMWASIERIMALPDEVQIFCGHDYGVENAQFAVEVEPDNPLVHERLDAMLALRRRRRPGIPTTIGAEKQVNPFLRPSSSSIRKTLHMKHAADVEVFAELRRRKDHFHP